MFAGCTDEIARSTNPDYGYISRTSRHKLDAKFYHHDCGSQFYPTPSFQE
jgi:hypothetical protein